jgi:acyl carrier protein
MDANSTYFEAIRSAIDLPRDFELSTETVIANVPGWDSFGWVAVILALEKLSGKDFPIEDIENINNLDELLKKFKSN